MKKNWVLLGVFLLCISILIIHISLEGIKLADESAEGNLLAEITDFTIQRDIPYAQDANQYHLMNVYIPEGDGIFPAIVYIHGGGWTAGYRDSYDSVGSFYARRGIAGFSIDYTLTAENTSWPQAIQDVILAIRHIKENSAQYRIDPERVAVMGDSAGGHLASLVGTLSGNESFLTGKAGKVAISSRVCLVIDYYGPTDFQFIGECGPNCNPYCLVEAFLGDVSYEMNQSRWSEASPATYITDDDPIFVIAHGTNDPLVPIAISESFISKLDGVGVETYFVKVEGGVHGFSDKENSSVRYVLEPLLKQVFSIQ